MDYVRVLREPLRECSYVACFPLGECPLSKGSCSSWRALAGLRGSGERCRLALSWGSVWICAFEGVYGLWAERCWY